MANEIKIQKYFMVNFDELIDIFQMTFSKRCKKHILIVKKK